MFLWERIPMFRTLLTLALLVPPVIVSAHDTWVQTNTPLIRVGDAVHIDLMLGNHGNDHRDFKLASKVDPAEWQYGRASRPAASATTYWIASSIWAMRRKRVSIRPSSPSPSRGCTRWYTRVTGS